MKKSSPKSQTDRDPSPKETGAEEAQASDHKDLHPLEVVRSVYRQLEIAYQDEDDALFTRFNLQHVVVEVVCRGEPDDIALIIVAIPARAAPKFRAAAGEFLHRLNFGAKRKFWEIDYNDGEIRMVCYTDTFAGPLTEPIFRSLLDFTLLTADMTFPYLTSVLSGRMTPEFAADQAEAAIRSMCDDEENEDEE